MTFSNNVEIIIVEAASFTCLGCILMIVCPWKISDIIGKIVCSTLIIIIVIFMLLHVMGVGINDI